MSQSRYPAKLGRRFRMEVEGNDGRQHVFGEPFMTNPKGLSPLTIEFDINRQTLSDANTGTFTLRNLSPDSRKSLWHDRFDWGNYKKIEFWIGYASDNSKIKAFSGNITEAFSRKEPPDWVTQITAFDGGYDMMDAHAEYVSQGATTDLGKALETIIKSGKPMKHTSVDKEASSLILNNASLRGITISESTYPFLQETARKAGYALYIDMGVLYLKSEADFQRFGRAAPRLITTDTGLVGTPTKYWNMMDVALIMEPSVKIGDFCTVVCSEPECNGAGWQVRGIHHHGKISPTSGGSVITTLSLFNNDIKVGA